MPTTTWIIPVIIVDNIAQKKKLFSRSPSRANNIGVTIAKVFRFLVLFMVIVIKLSIKNETYY
jgi:hypothetical protein